MIFKCKMCGGTLDVKDGESIAECEFCGTKQTIPVIDDEKSFNLHNRANALRLRNEFDKAIIVYENILTDNPDDAEAHWGLLLCKYGIEYVDDPTTGKKIPTCHRTQFDSVFSDTDYKTAIKNADVLAKGVYEAEAKEIDGIQKHILEISQKEERFDVFICYKETDESGQRTMDSVIAQDVYAALTKKGYKVFFSRITLESKLGEMYEPYIFAALNSAKVMLVIGTKERYFNAVWVRNEWSRFIKIMEHDRDKYLIPCYKDMDAYDLPMEMASFQAQDMGKIGFLQDLLYGIDKLFGQVVRNVKTEEKPTAIVQNGVNVSALLERAQILIEDGDIKKADSLLEKVLNNDPKNAKAYFCKLLIDLNLKTVAELNDFDRKISSEPNYIKAYRYADDAFRAELTDYESRTEENEKKREKEETYAHCIKLYNCNDDIVLVEAAKGFLELEEYKDSNDYYRRCIERLEKVYEKATKHIEKYEYDKALALLGIIRGYRDAGSLIEKCRTLKGKEAIYRSAVSLAFNDSIHSLSAAVEKLKTIIDYRDSAVLIEKYNRRIDDIKRRDARTAKIKKITLLVIAAIIAVTLLTVFLFIPLAKYSKAEKAYKNGNYDTAIALYEDLYRNHNNFKDADAKLKQTKYKKADLLVKQCKYAEAQEIFNSLGDYKNSVVRWGLAIASERFSNGNYIDGINRVTSVSGIVEVVFDTDGGTGIPDKQFIYNYATPKDFIAASKAGYTFVEWQISEWEVGVIPIESDGYKTKVTLKAVYAANTYNLTYELNGGSCETLLNAYIFGSGAKLPVPERAGYTFNGWSFGDGEPFFDVPVDTYGDKKLYAVWVANSYTITYNANGGNIDKQTQTAVFNAYVTLETPSRDAYTFAGWYKGDVLVGNGTWTFAENVVLIARWTKNEFNIGYDLDGGTNAENNPTSYVISDTEIVVNDPTKTGYIFLGWTGYGLNEYTKNLVIAAGSWGDLSFTANWQANTYTITYNYNDGVTAETKQSVTFDSVYSLVLPNRNGYTFGGWYVGGQEVTAGVYKTAEDITVKAKWRIITYTIAYNLNGGSVIGANPMEYTIETETFTIVNPIKIGYSFIGWTLGISDIKKLTIVIEKGSFGNFTFVAFYEANNYTLSFDENGGDFAIESVIVTYDNPFVLSLPSRVGYTFNGWFYEGNEITDGIWKYTDDIELTAQWIANNDTAYRVEHYLENADDEDYTLTKTEDFIGTSDSFVTPSVNTYDHFSSPATQSVTISPDGSLVVTYFYSRKNYEVTFVANGGVSILSTVQKYDSVLSVGADRSGYEFGGWYYEPSLTTLFGGRMSGKDFTLYAYWSGETITNEFEYKIEDSVATITKFIGESANVVLPTYIDNTVVSVVGNRAFENCIGLESIKFSFWSVKTIEGGAFYNCTGLTSVAIPNSVNSIGIETFAGCSNLQSLTIPFVGAKSGVKSTDLEIYPLGYIFGNGEYTDSYYARQHVKYDNDKITEYGYFLPKSLKIVKVSGGEILDYAFENCAYVENIAIPENIKELGESAFWGCGLKSFEIPQNVTEIKRETFKYCYRLENIIVPDEVKILGSGSFAYCENLTGITLPDGLQKIDMSVFQGCKSLKSIVIPNNVTEILASAFGGCESLESITTPCIGYTWGDYEYSILGWFETVLSDAKFDSTKYCKTLKWCIDPVYGYGGSDYVLVPLSLSTIILTKGERIWGFKGWSSLTSVVLPDTIKSIEDRAFTECSELTTINLPKNLQTIGAYAFSDCEKLKSMTIPDSVETIGEQAFAYCTELEDLTIGHGLTEISEYAFQSCGISYLKLSDNIRKIANGAFNSCENLSAIEFGDGIKSIGENAFAVCKNLRELNIPRQVEVLYGTSFRYCPLQRISVPAFAMEFLPKSDLMQVDIICGTAILKSSFSGCSQLTSITLCDTITSIGANAFNSCTGLTCINLPHGITTIDTAAFYGCGGLTEIVLPTSLITIGNSAFGECSGIVEIKIPSSVTSIGNSIFYKSDSFEKYIVENDNIMYSAIDGILYNAEKTQFVDRPSALKGIITIPEGIKSIGMSFFDSAKVEEVILPDSVTSIEKNAFAYCAMKRLTIGRGLKEVGKLAFTGCTQLQGVYIKDLSAWCKISFAYAEHVNPLEYAHNLYLQDQLITNLILPESITYLSDFVFYGCTSISNVVLHDKITGIGAYALSGSLLSKVFFTGNKGQWDKITFGSFNPDLTKICYFYSESEPPLNADGSAYDDNYWHYDTDDITPKIWGIEE